MVKHWMDGWMGEALEDEGLGDGEGLGGALGEVVPARKNGLFCFTEVPPVLVAVLLVTADDDGLMLEHSSLVRFASDVPSDEESYGGASDARGSNHAVDLELPL